MKTRSSTLLSWSKKWEMARSMMPVLSNGPIESLNRKVKDLRRIGHGFRNFEHFRNRFLYATRSSPVLNGISDHNPVTYFEDDDF
ncbi:MAG: transposase [Lachnospiraceae bacterium]